MTTITIKNGKIKKPHFLGISDLLQYLAKNDMDYNDPEFKDTIVTDDIIKNAETIREEFLENPDAFKRVI